MKFVFFRRIRVWLWAARMAATSIELRKLGLNDDARRVEDLALVGAVALESLGTGNGPAMLKALEESPYEELVELARKRQAARKAARK